MDTSLRELERRWLETNDPVDQFRWLCRKHSLGVDPALEQSIDALTKAAQSTYDSDVSVLCQAGFVTTEPDPLKRLRQFSKHAGWYPADLNPTLSKVLNVKKMGLLYPHFDFDTGVLSGCFLQLFEGGVAFANFTEHGDKGSVWSRSSSRLEGPLKGWEHACNLAIGATLGPLVGFLSVNARESL